MPGQAADILRMALQQMHADESSWCRLPGGAPCVPRAASRAFAKGLWKGKCMPAGVLWGKLAFRHATGAEHTCAIACTEVAAAAAPCRAVPWYVLIDVL